MTSGFGYRFEGLSAAGGACRVFCVCDVVAAVLVVENSLPVESESRIIPRRKRK